MSQRMTLGTKIASIGRYLGDRRAIAARIRWQKFNWPIYETVRYVSSISEGFDCVLDVGASVGIFAQATMEAFPRAVVHAFEPLDENRASLERLQSRYGRDRLRIWPVALGAEEGTSDFHVSRHLPSSSILTMNPQHATEYPGTAFVERRRVLIRRLDQMIGEVRASGRALMKLDVQGYELEVLRGAEATLNIVDACVLEVSMVPLYDGAPSFHALDNWLEDHGLTFAGPVAANYGKVSGRLLQMDALFLRREGVTWRRMVGAVGRLKGV